jgi:hypothetical protein
MNGMRSKDDEDGDDAYDSIEEGDSFMSCMKTWHARPGLFSTMPGNLAGEMSDLVRKSGLVFSSAVIFYQLRKNSS